MPLLGRPVATRQDEGYIREAPPLLRRLDLERFRSEQASLCRRRGEQGGRGDRCGDADAASDGIAAGREWRSVQGISAESVDLAWPNRAWWHTARPGSSALQQHLLRPGSTGTIGKKTRLSYSIHHTLVQDTAVRTWHQQRYKRETGKGRANAKFPGSSSEISRRAGARPAQHTRTLCRMEGSLGAHTPVMLRPINTQESSALQSSLLHKKTRAVENCIGARVRAMFLNLKEQRIKQSKGWEADQKNMTQTPG